MFVYIANNVNFDTLKEIKINRVRPADFKLKKFAASIYKQYKFKKSLKKKYNYKITFMDIS